ncbi:MAG: enoyl-CoA hydratase/isomerase family protein [Bacillota bacterium]
MNYEEILTKETDGVCLIKINRPEMKNKLSIKCMNEIMHVLESKSKDDSCYSVILAGNGEYFCSGGELGDFRVKTPMEIKDFGSAFIKLHTSMVNFPKPIIAAVEGDALGGGFSLVEACDFAVAAESALLAIPEILDGLAPAMGLSGIFAQLPKKVVMSLGLLGHKFTAEEALMYGMVNYVVKKDEVLEKAYELAKSFKDKSPTAVRLFKELFVDMGLMDYDRRLRLGQSMMITLLKSNDGMEVLQSKEQKREPKWQRK